MSVFLPKEIDFSKITFGEKKGLKNGAENCVFQYNGQKINVQLPKAVAPFGVNNAKENPKTPSPVDKFSVAIPFDTNNKKLVEAKKFFDDMDQFIIDYVFKNCEKILGSKKSRDVIEEAYEPMVKKSKDPKYPDKIKLKLVHTEKKVKVNGTDVCVGVVPMFKVAKESTVNDKKVWTELELSSKNDKDMLVIDWSWAEKRMNIIPIIECEGLYIINKKIYCSWRIIYLRVCESSANALNTNSFRQEEEEDSEQTEQTEKPVSEGSDAGEYVEESDEE